MSAHLIIDGHNLLHAVPEWAAMHRQSPEMARERLIVELEAFADDCHEEVSLVFDGAGRKISVEQKPGSPLRVVYSGKGMSADSVIERVTRQHAGGLRMTVVSNDNLIRESATHNGAFAMKVKDFLKRLESSQSSRRKYLRRD